MAKFAIIIGINEYKRQGDLLYAERDASEFADALVQYCDFSYEEIALLTSDVNDGKRVELADVEAQFARAKNLGKLDAFVFMFCGRGRLDEDRATRRFCFSDADEEDVLLESSFTLQDLLGRLGEFHASNSLFFFDARPSEEEYATQRELEALEKFADDVAVRWKNASAENPNVLAINSCSDGQTSYDDKEYERGLAPSHLTWILQGFFTTKETTFAQLAERLPEVVALRADELRVGVQKGYHGADYVAQRPFCKLVGDGNYVLPTRAVSEEERAAVASEIIQRGEKLFNSGKYKRARLAAERALELKFDSTDAQSLKNRAYREEVAKFVGVGDFFGATNALVNSNLGLSQSSFGAFRKGLRLLGVRIWNSFLWLASFKKKGARRWKVCFWILCLALFYGVGRDLFSYYHNEIYELRRLPQGVWDGEEPGDFQSLTIGDVNFPFRYCPPGTFKMGSPWYERGRDSDERLHKATLTKGFWILETETTQAMWRAVCGDDISYFEGDDRPVEQISWLDCQRFIEEINKLGVAPKGWKFSLPTEAQWEYACRAGENEARVLRRLDVCAWYWENATESHEVYGKEGNAWGIFDMRGNVWEWCSDVYAPFLGRSVVDPEGPPEREGAMRVLRGGCWGSDSFCCRAANRFCYFSGYGDSYQGFRIVLIRAEEGESSSVQDESTERSSEKVDE